MPATRDGERGGVETAALGTIIAARLAGNVLIRFPYTYITAISQAFGVRVDTMAALLGARELGGLLAPTVGRVSDRGHERRVMVAMTAVAALATLGVALRPPLWLLAVTLLVGGVAKFGLDTAQNAWIAHRVSFTRRSAVFGVVESSWALALLVGIPLCGAAGSLWGWRAMFLLCGGALGVAAASLRWVLPADRSETPPSRSRGRSATPLRGVYAYVALQPFAQMFVFAVYGDWFRTDLDMSDAGLAATSMLIGVGELVGTALSALFADRTGKRRSAMAGILLAAPLAGCLGLVGGHRSAGVTLIVVMAVGMEFSFVSALPLVTELDPTARGSAIGRATAIITIARALSSALAGRTYVQAGIGATGVIGAALCLAAAASLRRVTEPVRR